jgi:hypothetical protein
MPRAVVDGFPVLNDLDQVADLYAARLRCGRGDKRWRHAL